MDLESGWLGKVFGTGANCNVNIAGLIAVMLILPALVFTFFNLQAEDKMPVLEFWKSLHRLLELFWDISSAKRNDIVNEGLHRTV